MTKPQLSISFHNFWGGFVPETSYFLRALNQRFDVRVEPFGRDIQFFSVFGRHFPDDVLRSTALKVWFTGEAQDAKDLIYDLTFGFHANPLLGSRSIRLPLWATNIDWWSEDGPLSHQRLVLPRTFQPRPKFCNFIYSNPVSLRNEFFARLNARQRVDSYGKVLNNMGGRAKDKLQTLADYRFTIAFENFLSPGYVTEKLLEPLACGSIPIYWGAPECRLDFNPSAFIDASQFSDMDALIDHVMKVESDEELQRALIEAPVFANGIPYEMTPAFFVERIETALETPAMRGHGRDINPQLSAKRNTKGRIRASFKKIARKIGF